MAQALTKSPVTSWEDFGGDARGVDVAGGAFSSDSSSKTLGLPEKNNLVLQFDLFTDGFFLNIKNAEN